MGFGGEKRWGYTLKSSFGMAIETTREEIFMGKGGSHYVILLY